MTSQWKKVGLLLAASVAVVAAWWIVPTRWIDRLLGASADVGAASDAKSSTTANDTLAELASLRSSAAKRTAEPTSSNGDGNLAAAAAPLPKAGHVTLRVVDAHSRATVGNVRAKFLCEKRYAEYSGVGEFDLQLTPGRWEAVVVATGYEPARVEPFDVESSVITHLETVALDHGCGTIEGHVVARHLASDVAASVQLFGDGRSKCEQCLEREREPSPVNNDAGANGCCGFGNECSEFSLAGDRRFRFPRLAAGVYWLRAFDPAQRIVAARRIELARGGDVWQELDVSAPTSARFELRHERGGLFTGDWTSVHHEKSAPIVFDFRRNGKSVGEARIEPTHDDVRSTMGGPLFPSPGEKPSGEGAVDAAARKAILQWFTTSQDVTTKNGVAQELVIFTSGRVQSVGQSGWTIVMNDVGADRGDRERKDGDALSFDCPEPNVGGASLAVEKLRSDEFLVKPLPRELLTVVVTCGNYASEELPLDLRFERFSPLVVPMLPTEPWRAQLVEIAKGAPAACNVCHNSFNAFAFENDGNLDLFTGNSFTLSGSNGDVELFLDKGNGTFESSKAPDKK